VVGELATERTITPVCVTSRNGIILEKSHPTGGRAAYNLPHRTLGVDETLEAGLNRVVDELAFVVYNYKRLPRLSMDLPQRGVIAETFLVYGGLDQETRPALRDDTIITEARVESALEMMRIGQIDCTFCVSAIFLALQELGWLQPTFPRATGI